MDAVLQLATKQKKQGGSPVLQFCGFGSQLLVYAARLFLTPLNLDQSF